MTTRARANLDRQVLSIRRRYNEALFRLWTDVAVLDALRAEEQAATSMSFAAYSISDPAYARDRDAAPFEIDSVARRVRTQATEMHRRFFGCP